MEVEVEVEVLLTFPESAGLVRAATGETSTSSTTFLPFPLER